MKRMFLLFAVILVFSTCAAQAGNTYFWSVDGELLNYKKTSIPGSLCWNTETREDGLRVTTLRMEDGKVRNHPNAAGYVIQKDSDEYSGVLMAREENSSITIVHQDEQINEILYQGSGLQPFEDGGIQTVRAYMRGALYFIKPLTSSPGIPGQFCRIDADGREYAYRLVQIDDVYSHRLISGYALHPNGTLAWVENNAILVDSPETGSRVLVDDSNRDTVGAPKYIREKGLCWLDERTLVFYGSYDGDDPRNGLHILDLESGSATPLTAKDGGSIVLPMEVSPGSCLYPSPDGRYLAYMGMPNNPFCDYWSDSYNCDVPILIDLETGKVRYTLEYPNDDLPDEQRTFRSNYGQLTWYEPVEP